MRYYSTLRPITLGTCPKKEGMQVVNFEDRQYIESIGREAWGYVEYTEDITTEEAAKRNHCGAKSVRRIAQKK